MRILLIFLLALMSNSLIAQDSKTASKKYDKCKLSQENKIWWEKAKSETDTIKLINSIKEKITSDTIYKKYIPKVKIAHSSSLNLEYIDENENLCGQKILFVIEYRKDKSLTFAIEYKKDKSLTINGLENSNQIDIINEITPDNTKIFLIPADEGGTALFGSSGAEGVVYIKTKSKTLKKKIKDLNKKPNS